MGCVPEVNLSLSRDGTDKQDNTKFKEAHTGGIGVVV